MFNSTIELISLATSNPLFVFCFCNLIIAILLVGGSKPASELDQVGPVHPPTIAGENENDTVEGINAAGSAGNNGANDDGEARVGETRVDEERKNKGSEGDDDELRRRVEEFIDKINRGWKAEKLKAEKFRASLLV